MATYDLSAQRVRELLNYDSDTGIFTRKVVRPCKDGRPGAMVGVVTGGYLRARVECSSAIPLHRLAWLHFYGEWPIGDIDHINGDKQDNRISNLRDVPRAVNTQNLQSSRKDNKLKLLGVHRRKNSDLFYAQIQMLGKKKHLGSFNTPEEAHAAYIEAKRQMHPGCTI